MKKILIPIIAVVMLVAGGVFFLSKKETAPSEKIKIAATFYPLAEFARHVGGDRVEVTTIVPNGVEPHDYEPTPQDIATIRNADLFIYLGEEIDGWATKIDLNPEKGEAKTLPILRNLLNSIQQLGFKYTAENVDPHVWLDPVLTQEVVQLIYQAMGDQIIVVADTKSYDSLFNKNLTNYQKELQKLDNDYRNGLANCKQDTAISSHDALGYLSRRYGFTVYPIAGLSPEEEPSPRIISQLITLARQSKLKYILFETLVSPRIAETIAKEVGAQTLVFNPIEGLTSEEQERGENYISLMRANLATMRLALECQ